MTVLCACTGGDKHRLLSQVVRPQEPLLRSPPRAAPSDDKHSHWKDEERRGSGDKREAHGRHEELEARGERSRVGNRRGDTPPDSRSRGRDQRESTPPPSALATGGEDRETAGAQSHEEGKKKTKSQKKGLKKGRKEEEVAGVNRLAPAADRFNSEPQTGASADGPPTLQSPRKGAKKKALDRKRKRSRGGDSDVSEEDTSAHQPHNKRKRGPRTPPPSMRPNHRGTGGNTELSPLSKVDNFSDWSDEEVTDRGGGPLEAQAPLAPSDRVPAEPLRRGGGPRVGRDRERCNPPAIAPLLSQEPPMLLQTLTPQPLMSKPLLRKPPPEQTRSSSMGSNQSRTSSRRPRSPSNESAHRDDLQGPRSRRGRLQGTNSRDRDRERERERDRPGVNDPPGAERKSRIDQLRRGEPSRSTSSGKYTPVYQEVVQYLIKCLTLVLPVLTHLFSVFQTGRIHAATAPDAAPLTLRGRPGPDPALAPTTVENGKERGSHLSGNGIETEKISGLSSSNSSSSNPCSFSSHYNNRETGSLNLGTGLAGGASPC